MNALGRVSDYGCLAEDNPFLSAQHYGERFRNTNRGRALRGTFYELGTLNPRYWFDAYAYRAFAHKYFGTKVALGPFGTDYWEQVDHDLVSFFVDYFPHGSYLLPTRQPVACIASMHHMFPGTDFGDLFNTYIKSYQIQLSLLARLQKCVVVNVDLLTTSSLTAILGRCLNTITRELEHFVRSPRDLDAEDRIWMEPYSSQLAALNSLHERFLADFDMEGNVRSNVGVTLMCESLCAALEALRANPRF